MRMGGVDKGALTLGGHRLVDHVIGRLKSQVDRILIAGPHDYETGLTNLTDGDDGPLGPAAGLWSMANWMGEHAPEVDGFLTVPVDGPFFPAMLFERLAGATTSSIVRDETGDHPTFAYWRRNDLRSALGETSPKEGNSLTRLASMVDARRVLFPGTAYFQNINTPEDLEKAEEIAARSDGL